MGQPKDTSWQKVAGWYKESVGLSGHYYHQHLVLPKSIDLLRLKNDSSVLDLACGQGVLGRALKGTSYLGIDASPSLIKYAKQNDQSKNHSFQVSDIEKPLPLAKKDFSHATIILALQNLERPENAIKNASVHLQSSGKLLLVINHPCFRIPRQSSWEIDEKNKLQYRRINRYFSSLKIPIAAKPSLGRQSPLTWSFHHSLQEIFRFLTKSGFIIINLEEWISEKGSEGKAAKMENRGRSEFPLFMAILAEKRN